MARPPWRVRDRATFERLHRSPVRARRGPLSVTWTPAAAGDPPRVAFAIGRRVGTAVARNRLRRRLRAALAEVGLAPGVYLVAAGPEAAQLPWAELRSALAETLARVTERSEVELGRTERSEVELGSRERSEVELGSRERSS